MTDSDRSLLKVIVSESSDTLMDLAFTQFIIALVWTFESTLFLWLQGKEGGFKVEEPSHPRAVNRQVVSDNR